MSAAIARDGRYRHGRSCRMPNTTGVERACVSSGQSSHSFLLGTPALESFKQERCHYAVGLTAQKWREISIRDERKSVGRQDLPRGEEKTIEGSSRGLNQAPTYNRPNHGGKWIAIGEKTR